MKIHLRFRSFLILSVFLAASNLSFGQISLVPFVNNVNNVTDITHCGDERLFIVEQDGYIRISDLQGNLNPVPYLDIIARVQAGGEQGLLGLAFSPDYATDGRFYVNYINNQGNTVIARFNVSANPDVADSSSEEILFTVLQPFSNHNGGAMFFGKDGYLYISLGDGGSAGDPGNRAQNLAEDLGKLLRIDVNVPSGYSIPGSNPFYGSPTANPRIWAYGLRNAWRVNKDRLTGDIWIADVGQGNWEEVNVQPFSSAGGENYGWRCYEGNAVYNATGCLPASNYVSPVYVLGHPPACSITGGFVYRGAQNAGMYGKYFFTDYCNSDLRSLEPNGAGGYTEVNYGNFTPGSFATFGEDKYGELYIGRNSTGVVKIADSTCLPVAFISTSDTIVHCGNSYLLSTPAGQGFIYQWYFNGSPVVGGNSDTLTVSASGTYTVETVNAAFCPNVSDPVYLEIIPAPDVTLTGLPSILCVYAPTVTVTGSPSGGIYSGAGVVNDTFDPATAGVGTHIVTYAYDNGNGCIVQATSSIIVDECLSVPEIPATGGFVMYPNPASAYTELIFSDNNSIKNLAVTDITGRVAFKTTVEASGKSYRLETGTLSKGIYLVSVMTNDNYYYKKLVIR